MIRIASLRNVEIFRGLPDEELKVIAGFCQEESLPGGVTLYEERARADKLFILEEGAVSTRFKKGVNYTIQTPGRILGWSFLVPPKRYTATAVTIAPSKLLGINSPDFYDLVHRESKIGITILDNFAGVISSRLKAFVDYY